ncbi:MAG: nuclear transport factor 2 family protein [Hoeflea sp.]|uniref:nuclear transport factor 2 family protein n=1 Tax=Hoeflea sp. TaxID=1940281 RepID=UPI0032EF5C8D
MKVVRIRSAIAMVCLAAGMSVVSMASARAENGILERWYTALFDVDREALSELLADEALIQLEDLGITQTKAEYIASLDEWEEVAQNTNFAWQIDAEAPQDADQATALVCYQFPDNDLMMREVFSFGDGRITGSVQSAVGDTCEEF